MILKGKEWSEYLGNRGRERERGRGRVTPMSWEELVVPPLTVDFVTIIEENVRKASQNKTKKKRGGGQRG
eukprot:scaffold27461_cov26-Tisochrysis_lutea.AAC.1